MPREFFTQPQREAWTRNAALRIASALCVNRRSDEFDGIDELAFYCTELANSIWIQSRQADKE